MLDNVVQDDNANYDEKYDYENPPKEEWMILSNYKGMHKHPENSYNWQLDSTKYTAEQISSMNKWISNQRSDYTVAARYYQIDRDI